MKELDLCDSCKRHIEREVLRSKGYATNTSYIQCENMICERSGLVKYTILCMEDKRKPHDTKSKALQIDS